MAMKTASLRKTVKRQIFFKKIWKSWFFRFNLKSLALINADCLIFTAELQMYFYHRFK